MHHKDKTLILADANTQNIVSKNQIFIMKKLSILLFAVICLGVLFASCITQKPKIPMNFNLNDYTAAWKTIDSLEQQGLPKSALEKVESLYTRAKSDNNPSQIVKTLLYKSKYTTQLEEDGLIKAIYNLQQESESATFPTNAILQSILAELYNYYLEQNYWRFQNRSTVEENFKIEDIRTWSIDKLLSESARLYKASLQDDNSQNVALHDIQAITNQGQLTEKIRPTLFDFLAHRAIAHFTNQRSHLTEAIYKFYINEEAAFAPANTFIQHSFETKDSTSKHHTILLILQDLLRFHENDSDFAAFLDADLSRLKFVKEYATLANKNQLYFEALQQLAEKHKSQEGWAEIQYHIAYYYFQKSANSIEQITDKNKDHRKTAYDICAAAIAKYPESYGAKMCQSLQNQITNKQLSINTEIVNLRNAPFLTSVRYQNVDQLHFKLIAFDEKKEKKLNKVDYHERITYLNSLKSMRDWSEKLPDDGRYNPHRVELKIDALAPGLYLLMASDTTDFSTQNHAVSYQILAVSNLACLFRTIDGKQKLLIVDRLTGAPVQGAKASIHYRNYNSVLRINEYKKRGDYTSDKDGFIHTNLDYINKKDRNSYQVHLSKGKDFLRNAAGFYLNDRNYEPRKHQVTHFFLDRAIYRPQQTIYFKALVLEIDQQSMPRILPNQAVSIIFKDANRQEVERLELTTNEYGTVNGSFTAPSNGLLGSMHLKSSIPGNKYFRVEEYKRPKFEAKIEPIEGSFRLGDKVVVKGNAKAFAGNNIDGAKVQYRVVRKAYFPYMPYWYYRRWNPQNTQMEIINGNTQSDENGVFEIPFELLPDPTFSKDKKPKFTYTVYADVTDITGETHSTSANISAGYIALDADIQVPERVNRDSLKTFDIITKNLSGQFEAAQGKITIQALKTPKRTFRQRFWSKPDQFVMTKAEFYKDFPFDVYDDENEAQNWEREKVVLEENFDTKTAKSIKFDKINWEVGKYILTLSTQDKYGEAITIEKIFTLYDLDTNKVAGNPIFDVIMERNSFEPSETAIAYTASAEKELNILFDVSRNKKITKQEWFKLKGRKKYNFPVNEADRGNFYFGFTFVKNNRVYTTRETVVVPWSNKMLQIEYMSFRDKLYPGQEEEWQIKLSGPKKEKVAAEMLAAMYDASLDQFAANNWSLSLFHSRYPVHQAWQAGLFQSRSGSVHSNDWNPNYQYDRRTYPSLNWFDFFSYNNYYGGNVEIADQSMMLDNVEVKSNRRSRRMMKSAPATTANANLGSLMDDQEMEAPAAPPPPPGKKERNNATDDNKNTETTDFSAVNIRTNLDETVFFFPNLQTDEAGNIIIKFKMNEALTRWKFLGLAHTKDLKTAITTKEVVTQKDLMVVPNPPRFFREGDTIEFTAKVSNLTEREMTGTAVLQLYDAVSMQAIDDLFDNKNAQITFTAKAGQSDRLAWKLSVPKGKVYAVTHRVIAKSGNFSDGEESSLPVLTNRMLVTETMPLPVRGKEKKSFTFERMNTSKSSTLQHHAYTLEFTSNPAWYAVQALPYIMEYPYECTEQVFNRLYANSLATSVANSHPKVKRVFDQWKGTDAMLSNLSKNEELKTALLEETPWVLAAQSEAAQKKRIGLLFDLNKMSNELNTAIEKIKKRQLNNGGFSWFPGGRDNRYITQYLVEGFGHLKALNALEGNVKSQTGNMLQKAVKYTDKRIVEDYNELKKDVKRGEAKFEDDHLNYHIIHYLYARSFFLDQKRNSNLEEAYIYYLGQAEKYWLNKGIYSEGLLALALARNDKKETALKIAKSLKERSINHEELGMYWKNTYGYHWYQLPIETHSLMIEVFAEVAEDANAVEDLKIWLLKNKQTTHWKTTKGTAAAVYAMLKNGNNWLLDDQAVLIDISRKANRQIEAAQANAEAGTGYFKTTWSGDEITKEMATIKVNNPNNVVAWGGIYWQYFEELDKITHFEDTPLKLDKKVFKEVASDRGPVLEKVSEKTPVQVGDKLKIRIELRVDRAMEYVHMKDMRASGLEPLNVLSTYKWQDGLGYYESTRDAATNFFFSYLSKGTYVFEYPLRVVHEGDFSNGITTIQSMYAPEFTSHSEGIRLQVQ